MYGSQGRANAAMFPLTLFWLIASWLLSNADSPVPEPAGVGVGVVAGEALGCTVTARARYPAGPKTNRPARMPTRIPRSSRLLGGFGVGTIRGAPAGGSGHRLIGGATGGD